MTFDTLKRVLYFLGLCLITLPFLPASGCAFLGVPTAQTFNERAALALSSVTTARQGALTLLQAKRITPADADNIQRQADTARAAIDVARSLHATDPAAGNAKLTQAQTVLTALDAYLKTKGKTP